MKKGKGAASVAAEIDALIAGAKGKFDTAKHPHGAGGKFSATGGGKELKGAIALKTSGVGHGDEIVVLSKRSTAYKGAKTVRDFVDNHVQGKAYALRKLAADHKKGIIGFEAGGTAPKPSVSASNADTPASSSSSDRALQIQFGQDIDPKFAEKVRDGWDRIPSKLKDKLQAAGIEPHAPKRLIDTLPHLQNQEPRGWPAGSNFSQVDGVFDPYSEKPKIVVAQQALSKYSGEWVDKHRGDSAILHETGHAIDHVLGNVSGKNEFYDAFEMDLDAYENSGGKRVGGDYDYYLQPGYAGPSEMFAEMFAVINKRPSKIGTFDLDIKFPHCAAYVRQLIEAHS